MNKIDFTVLIPVFNTKAAELIEAVFSVHHTNQTIDQEYDILIVDDGSTDPSTGHALEFLKIAFDRVKVLHLPVNMGTPVALNRGHAEIKTEWVAIMGSSDISLEGRFKLQVEHLLANPDIDVLGTNLMSFAESDPYRRQIYRSSHGYHTTLQERSEGWLTNHGTAMYKLSSVNYVNGYDEKKRRYQDVDLWKRMDKAGKKIRTLAPVTYLWRKANV